MNRLLREAKLFDAKLGPIDGAGNVGTYLIQLVEGKQVAQPKTEAEPETTSEKKEAVEAETERPTQDTS